MTITEGILSSKPIGPATLMANVALVLINDGWKSINTTHPLPKADLYLDCRPLPNPFHDAATRPFSGDDSKVQDWMLERAQPFLKSFYQQIVDGLERIPDRRAQDEHPFEKPYTVCLLCAHGIHRSRAMKHILGAKLKAGGWTVEVK